MRSREKYRVTSSDEKDNSKKTHRDMKYKDNI